RSRQIADRRYRTGVDVVDCGDARSLGRRSVAARAGPMSSADLYGAGAAGLIGIGLFGLITHPQLLRKVLGFNLLGSGEVLLLGVVARRGAAAGFSADPVPQALVITGLVVAFASTALAVALLLRLAEVAGCDELDNGGGVSAPGDDRKR